VLGTLEPGMIFGSAALCFYDAGILKMKTAQGC